MGGEINMLHEESILTDNNNEYNKSKSTRKCLVKRKHKFDDYIHCLEVTQLENKINHLEKDSLNVDKLQGNHNSFIKTINWY